VAATSRNPCKGKSLITAAAAAPDLTADQEQIIKDRLSGLGYI